MDAVDEIKQRLNIEDVIGEYVELKRAGRNFRGLSPFSNEKSPSFMVSPDKQIWHDFSSGKGGNIFSFIMEVEGLDFKGALELLARKAGIDIEQFRGQRGQGNGKQKERLYEALELAAKFYQTQFSRNTQALEYILKKRAFSKDTALAWQIGYAPNNGTALLDFLKAKQFSEQEIKLAGLSATRYRTSDMFRGRIMIPLADPQGRVIGFTARLLEDIPDAPKYINTPQTPLYDKSRHVYGLHLAKDAIRRNNYAVISEGNLDVIASHQAGVQQVVATAGTALTEQHLKTLSRFTHDIRLAFDADKAGLNATERAIPIASKVGVTLSIVTIPSGKDPDELIRQDKSLWEEVITQPQPALDWLMERYEQQLDITTAPGKRQFSDVLLPIVQALDDTVEKDHYLNQLAETLQISREALLTKLHKTPASNQPVKKQVRTTPAPVTQSAELRKLIGNFLSIMLVQPSLRHHLDGINSAIIVDKNSIAMTTFLQANQTFSVKNASDLTPDLREYGNELLLQYEELFQDLDPAEFEYVTARLYGRIIEQYVKGEKQLVGAAMAQADGDDLHQLLVRAKALDDMLRQLNQA